MKKRKVLILTMSVALGHNVTANIIENELLKCDINCKKYDISNSISSFYRISYQKSFNQQFSAPKFSRRQYNKFKNKKNRIVNSYYNKLIESAKTSLLDVINEYQPDIIISTHFVSRRFIEKYKNQIAKPFNHYFIVTDYDFTPGVSNGMENEYIVIPNEDFMMDGIHRNFKQEQLLPFGIPCKREFYLDYNKDEIIKNLPFKLRENQKLIVISGGGNGVGNIDKLAKQLIQNPNNFVVLITGKNTKILSKMQKFITKKKINNLYLTNFVEDYVSLVYSADLIVGKTGGLTSTECIALATPIISYSNIPSPEYNNLQYLLDKKLCISFSKVKSVGNAIDSANLEEISNNMKKYRNSDGLDKLINHIKNCKINI
ncbi:MAG: glycosyltransferase [Christensenellales bacterium]